MMHTVNVYRRSYDVVICLFDKSLFCNALMNDEVIRETNFTVYQQCTACITLPH